MLFRSCYVGHCHIVGFSQAIYGNGCGRHVFENITGDNTNGIWLSNVMDVGRTTFCHFWTFINYTMQYEKTWRDGIAFRFGPQNNDWADVSNCSSYGYKIGFQIEASNMSFHACAADATDGSSTAIISQPNIDFRKNAGTIGFYITGNASAIVLVDCKQASHDIGYKFDATGGFAHRMIGCTSWSAVTSSHVSLLAGRLMMDNSLLYQKTSVAAIVIGANAAGYLIDNLILDGVGKGFDINAAADHKGTIGYNIQYINTENRTDGIIDAGKRRNPQIIDAAYGENKITYVGGTNDGANGYSVNMYLSRGTVAAKTAVRLNDVIVWHKANGWNGTSWLYTGGLRFQSAAGDEQHHACWLRLPEGS